jgi:hypothetical protein
VRVCFDELSNGETVGRFAGGEREVLRQGLISLVIFMSITSCAERFPLGLNAIKGRQKQRSPRP